MKNIHITVATGASLFSILEDLAKFSELQGLKMGETPFISLTIHTGVETLANKDTK